MSAPPTTAPPTGETPAAAPLFGLLIEFEQEQGLRSAARRVREAGYTQFDCHSPYPIHGLDAAAGIRMTRLPYIVLACGLVGAALGLGLQWWTNATQAREWLWLPNWLRGYNYRISGKPFFSLPADIPVMFELTVLLSALGAVLGMLILNNLPRFYQAWFRSARFRRVTNDRFFISLPASDARFDDARTSALAAALGGVVERVYDEPTPPPPRWITWACWILISLALVPPALVAKARFSYSEKGHIHVVFDMDNQDRYKAQQANPAFADTRAMRPQVPGTLARTDPVLAGDVGEQFFRLGGRLVPDPNTGLPRIAYLAGYPARITVDLPFVERGRERFDIYCLPCHGADGHGRGMTHERAVKLETRGWVQPMDLHNETLRNQVPSDPRPNGHIFNTITNGIRTMPAYGDQIPPRDRWAIIAYLRALQLSTQATPADVPPAERGGLR